MKTTMTAVALVLALGTAAQAQDVKPSTTTPSAAPAVTAPAATAPAVKPAEAAKPVLAPTQMQKVGGPTVPATQPAPAAQPKVEAKPAAAPAATTAPATKTAAPVAKLVDINTVSAADLAKLPKIGEAGAKQIIAGRPYKSVDDLVAKKVIAQDAFDAVKGLISVK